MRTLARWVGTVRRECLDYLLIVGPRHLARVLDDYVEHYNPPATPVPQPAIPEARSRRPARGVRPWEHVRRRDVIGGLIHEYDLVA
jgi:putative transposase